MNLITGMLKLFHWPICRAYARYILKDKPADNIFRILCGIQFLRVYHHWPDFLHGERFSEKLWNRMLHDRNPLLTIVSDKLRVRDYVAAKVGSEYLIRVLWEGYNPEEIPFDELPSRFVIKTNHGCGYNIIVHEKRILDRIKAKQQLRRWLRENYCEDTYIGSEWGYRNIKPTILIETFIEQSETTPVDFKFYCFAGIVEIVTLHFDRFKEHKTKAYNRQFEPYIFANSSNVYGFRYECPANFKLMVEIAESLSKEFEFIRVDLYNVNGSIYFGELTPYPAGVSSFRAIDISTLDHILGKKWIINT